MRSISYQHGYSRVDNSPLVSKLAHQNYQVRFHQKVRRRQQLNSGGRKIGLVHIAVVEWMLFFMGHRRIRHRLHEQVVSHTDRLAALERRVEVLGVGFVDGGSRSEL